MRCHSHLVFTPVSLAMCGVSGADRSPESQIGQDTGWVRVEVCGRLESDGSVPTTWEHVEWTGGRTGFAVKSPGNRMILQDMPQADIGRANAGVEWSLFLGDNRRLHALAQKLVGNVAIAEGTLRLVPRRDFFSGGGPMPLEGRFVIKVTNLRDAGIGPAGETPYYSN